MSKSIEIFKAHLYDDVSKLNHLPERTLNRLLRIRSGYTLWLQYPNKKNKEIVLHLTNQFKIEKSVAYQDVLAIQELLGSFQKSSKDWHQYNFNKMIQKSYEVAEKKNNSDAMTKAAAAYAKYNQLDKEITSATPWEDLKPQPFEMTENPEVIGIKRVPNIKDKIANLFAKYKEDINTIEDVTYEDVDIDFLNNEEQ